MNAEHGGAVAAATGDAVLRDEVEWIARTSGVQVPVYPSYGLAASVLQPGGVLLVGTDQLVDEAPPGLTVLRLAFAARAEHRDSGDCLALPRDTDALVRLLERAVRPEDGALVVGIVGARGGLGATVLAAATARCAAAQGLRTCLVDLDRGGGGIDVRLGLEEDPGARWSDLLAGSGTHTLETLPRWHRVGVLSAGGPGALPLDPVEVRSHIEQAKRTHQLVVLDLARGWGAADVARLAGWCDMVVVVAALDVPAVAGCLRLRAMVGDIPVVLAVRLPGTGRLTVAELTQCLGIKPAVRIRQERGLAADLDHGGAPGDRPRRALARAARQLLATIMDTRAP